MVDGSIYFCFHSQQFVLCPGNYGYLKRRVTDKKGKPIPDATVVVKFADAGIERSLVTKEDGRFTLANQRVGGPYTITVTHVMTHPELNR